ncbi:MAG: hypothetical protein JWP16_1217 [Alphaproteobacteria bacterium]|nr:hypothetical protein [Alphaproteobacteria bacterium]MDB5740177.1 hypothetical protein [Alphaproteobacteria bacterium]
MRVTALTVGLLLTSAVISTSAFAAPAVTHKVSCLCDCPDDAKAAPRHSEARPAVRRPVRRVARHSGGYYDYASAGSVGGGEWHGPWRVAPGDMIQAYDAPPQSYPVADYGPPQDGYGPSYENVRLDDKGWSGGVGANAEGGGGGGGGFMDGFGQVHFANGGSAENGPSYNSYNQSFQTNPSVAGPFQNRLMGGLAPVSSGK